MLFRSVSQSRYYAQLWGSLENLSKQGLQTDIMDGAKKGKFALLPCGKCEYRRKQVADQWATRIELEAKEWDDVIFLTLTYDDDHIPYGEIIKGYRSIQSQTVSKRDVQLFIKRLRKAYKKPIKYFLAAEYGGRTKRPHYHAIVFGLKPPDAQWYKNQKGNSYFKSERLQKIWGKGLIDFSPAQPGSFAYVACVVFPIPQILEQMAQTVYLKVLNLYPLVPIQYRVLT